MRCLAHRPWAQPRPAVATSSPATLPICGRSIRANRRIRGCIRPASPMRSLRAKPQVIVFATPKYCTSRVCGPVVDVVRTLIPTYGDRVVFIHEEIWETGSVGKFSPTVEEWNLRSEPWIFVVDGGGIVRARFEGLTTRRELEAALRLVLGTGQR